MEKNMSRFIPALLWPGGRSKHMVQVVAAPALQDRPADDPLPRQGGGGLAQGSVFAAVFFLEEADLHALEAVVPARQWQLAAGRRLLTDEEQAARERYFDQKAEAVFARLRAACEAQAGRRPRTRPTAA